MTVLLIFVIVGLFLVIAWLLGKIRHAGVVEASAKSWREQAEALQQEKAIMRQRMDSLQEALATCLDTRENLERVLSILERRES